MLLPVTLPLKMRPPAPVLMSLSTCPTPPRRQEAGAEEPTALTSQRTAAFLLTEMSHPLHSIYELNALKHWIDLTFIICLEQERVDAKHRSTLSFSVLLKLTEG